jgi:hypothetical protein
LIIKFIPVGNNLPIAKRMLTEVRMSVQVAGNLGETFLTSFTNGANEAKETKMNGSTAFLFNFDFY